MKNTRTLRVAFVGALVLAIGMGAIVTNTQSADAFGTVDSKALGQKAVHERITRVLGCESTQAPESCFQPLSIALLAGQGGTFGAVGEPDNPLDGNPNPAARHCDDGDHGYGSKHPKVDAWHQLSQCIEYYQKYMQFAVDSAAALLAEDGSVIADQTAITNVVGGVTNACTLPDPIKGNTSTDSAKCNVINGLGRALHVYEDWWSHTNWADVANSSKEVSLTNPKGMLQPGQPEYFRFPRAAPTDFPEDLISGCDDSFPVLGPRACKGRTGHSNLNTDNGVVDPKTCKATDPSTTRGKTVKDGVSNFQRGVTGACGAALSAWADLKQAFLDTYGPVRGAAIIRAVSADHAMTKCTPTGKSSSANRSPVGEQKSARSVDVIFINGSSATLECGDIVLDGGEWASYPPGQIAPGGSPARWRTQSSGFATGTEGSAKFKVLGSNEAVTVRWNNPYVGSNSYTCDTGGGYKCEVSTGSGNNAAITVRLTGGPAAPAQPTTTVAPPTTAPPTTAPSTSAPAPSTTAAPTAPVDATAPVEATEG